MCESLLDDISNSNGGEHYASLFVLFLFLFSRLVVEIFVIWFSYYVSTKVKEKYYINFFIFAKSNDYLLSIRLNSAQNPKWKYFCWFAFLFFIFFFGFDILIVLILFSFLPSLSLSLTHKYFVILLMDISIIICN